MENKIFKSDPGILGGTPVFYGTRVPIKNLFDYLETGETIDDFLIDFESVQKSLAISVLEISRQLFQNPTQVQNENFA